LDAATANLLPSCDDALIAAYKSTRTARTGNVFDQFDPPRPFRPCVRSVDGNPWTGGARDGERVIRFEGWEIHAPADTTDEAIVRVLDALSSPGAQQAPVLGLHLLCGLRFALLFVAPVSRQIAVCGHVWMGRHSLQNGIGSALHVRSAKRVCEVGWVQSVDEVRDHLFEAWRPRPQRELSPPPARPASRFMVFVPVVSVF
jgi:hypothetical protein